VHSTSVDYFNKIFEAETPTVCIKEGLQSSLFKGIW
jgi:hypothetical protein